MTWVKLDDAFMEHPKIIGLSPAAVCLHIAGLCYSSRNLTDGFIPSTMALRLTATATAKRLAELTESGVWDAVLEGWWIHDYLTYQPSRSKVLDERAQSAERQRKFRESRRDIPVTNKPVTRSRPDPTRSIDPSVKDFSRVVDEPVEKEVVDSSIASARAALHSLPRRETA
jgi:hypothetical protein